MNIFEQQTRPIQNMDMCYGSFARESQCAGTSLKKMPSCYNSTDFAEEHARAQLLQEKRTLDAVDSPTRRSPTLLDQPPPPPPALKRARQRKHLTASDCDPQAVAVASRLVFGCDEAPVEVASTTEPMDIATTTERQYELVAPREKPQDQHGVQQLVAPLTLSIPEEQPRSTVPQVHILTPLSSPMRRASSSDYDYAEDAEDSEDEKDDIFALLSKFDASKNPHTWWQERRKLELNVRSSINKTKIVSPLKFSPNTAFGAVKELRVKIVGRSHL